MKEIIKMALKGYKGRVSRRVWWNASLFWVLPLAVAFLGGMLSESSKVLGAILLIPSIIALIFSLFVLQLAANIGRLHDLGYSGWWAVAIYGIVCGIQLIPSSPVSFFVVLAILIFLGCTPGQIKANHWGDNPVQSSDDEPKTDKS